MTFAAFLVEGRAHLSPWPPDLAYILRLVSVGKAFYAGQHIVTGRGSVQGLYYLHLGSLPDELDQPGLIPALRSCWHHFKWQNLCCCHCKWLQMVVLSRRARLYFVVIFYNIQFISLGLCVIPATDSPRCTLLTNLQFIYNTYQ